MVNVYLYDKTLVSKPDDTEAANNYVQALEDRGYKPVLYNAPLIQLHMNIEQEWRYAAYLSGSLIFFRCIEDIDSFVIGRMMRLPAFRQLLPYD